LNKLTEAELRCVVISSCYLFLFR